jgi:hypothetical protein
MVIKIPAGTRIYLTKKKNHTLYIQPDKTLVNDNLYVAYDVRIGTLTIIPKGTRVMGDWVTESRPSIAAQLQIKKIFLQGSGQDIMADSDVIEAISEYNNKEVDNAGFLYKINEYRSPSNIIRRIASFHCRVRTLMDNKRNSIYLEIFTKEIPVTLTMDFIPYPYL